ncbi:MAG: hypothetical protein VYE27_06495 [Pseudomonadota bacterium]|nr:hypothetical protein [Pseudomonadota bacterium]
MSTNLARAAVFAVIILISVNTIICIFSFFLPDMYTSIFRTLLSASVAAIAGILLIYLRFYWKLIKTLEIAVAENKRQAAILETNSNKLNRFESKLLNLSSCDRNKDGLELMGISEWKNKKFNSKSFHPEFTQLELKVDQDHVASSTLPLSTDPIEITWPVLLRALHFPNDPNDTEGFLALKIAHQSSIISDVLRASEDLLNLLAQDGIYLDDLTIDQPPVEAWINFINSNREGLSRKLDCIGIEDRTPSLRQRVKSDIIFRDTALILIRRFDQMLKDRLEAADDNQIFSLAFTRTGKAFLIAGKICNSF